MSLKRVCQGDKYLADFIFVHRYVFRWRVMTETIYYHTHLTVAGYIIQAKRNNQG